MSYLKKKRIKVGIGIPSPDQVSPDFAIHSLTNLISYTRKNMPEVDLLITYEQGVRTDRNRNVILKQFIDEKVDYVLWLDADMVYPADMIERYLKDTKGDFDIIGCLYFKRTPPYSPIGYLSRNSDGKFVPVMPQLVRPGEIYEVSGLGYGGMMVSMKAYEKMGDKKWTKYGENFHIPWATEGNLTHDLQFCVDAKESGLKIQLHGSVRPGHIGEKLVTVNDYWTQDSIVLKRSPRTLVIMPSTDMELAQRSATVMKSRAGLDCEILILEDKNRKGYVYTANAAVKTYPDYELYVYTAQDAFCGQNWLLSAVLEQAKTGAGLVSLNNGRWNGALAAFGLVERVWMQSNYDGFLFFTGYKSHYADTELTQLAKAQGRYAYAPSSIMMEIDYGKDFGGTTVNKEDKELYKSRKEQILPKELAEEFS